VRARRRLVAAVVGGPALVMLSSGGCSGPVESSGNPIPACAPVIDALPGTVLGADRTGLRSGGEPIDAQWGAPSITFACGHLPMGPTTDQCITVDGVDWVFTDAGEDLRFTTYGTDPAAELVVPLDYGRENATGALVDLAQAVRKLPKNGRACVG
jgi:hypothetical protein